MHRLRLDRRPLYVQAYDRLRTLIQEGELQPGDRLPAEEKLAEQFGISRATLREALHLLEDEGAILRRQGVGTFVAEQRHLDTGLERLESVLDLAARQGMETQIENLSIDVIEADRPLVDQLGIPSGTSVTRVRRTVLVEEAPAAYLEDLVPAQWLQPDDLDDRFQGSVLDLLRRRDDPRIQEALAHITAVQPSDSLADRLGVGPDAVLLLLEETLYDVEGVPVGFSRNYFVPDRFRFHVIRR